jgi:hypothetical protein
VTYPGPWIQAPDYQQDGAESFPTGFDVEQYSDDNQIDYDIVQTPWSAGDVADAQTDIVTSAFGDYPDGAGSGFIQVTIGYGLAGGNSTLWDRRLRVWRKLRLSVISPFTLGVGRFAPDPSEAPTAVGWEWQDGATAGDVNRSQVLGLTAVVETLSTASSTDSTGGSTEVVASEFVTAVRRSGGAFRSDSETVPPNQSDTLTEWGGVSSLSSPLVTQIAGPIAVGAGEPNPTFTLDLTAHLDELGRVALASAIEFGSADPVQPANISGNGTLLYGHQLLYHPTWTFRPPVYRWLYDTPQVPPFAPPLRHHQREGRFATSNRNSSGRTRQGGLRNTGIL